ncbi:hypothetical protein [Burkholderia gladioli]|uniref:hypothetical protein n=1 Tax=Burkholderia gladioli TaxID=28095 RepID=UPI002FE11443
MYKSFRSADKQADHAVRQLREHGTPRHGNAGDGRVHSIGTERSYREALTGVAQYIKNRDGKQGDLRNLDRDTAIAYLETRAEAVGQKTLDLDRQAMQAVLGVPLPVVKSEQAAVQASRAYTTEQVAMVADAQRDRNALATAIAADAGLRAHELLTLRPADERQASAHRDWRPERFDGRGDVARYTVVGKGGLVREVALVTALADRLEAVRLEAPRAVYDREVRYEQHYDLAGGRQWADSFTKAAERALGWTEGAHGVRHTYAQLRMNTLQSKGYDYRDALGIVSQEMGHFRPDVTLVYLR